MQLALPAEEIPLRPPVLHELFSMSTRKTLLPNSLSSIESFVRSKISGSSNNNNISDNNSKELDWFPSVATITAVTAVIITVGFYFAKGWKK